MFNAENILVLSGYRPRSVQIPCQPLIKNLVDQTAFPGTGNTCNAGHDAQRNLNVYFLQIIFFSAFDRKISLRFSSALRHRNLQLPAQILSGDGVFYLHDFFGRAFRNYFSAMRTGPRPDIDNMVCGQHRIFIMFHYEQRISHIFQVLQRRNQFIVIPLMQTDTRLIQNIADADESGTNLRRQSDSLRLTA